MKVKEKNSAHKANIYIDSVDLRYFIVKIHEAIFSRGGIPSKEIGLSYCSYATASISENKNKKYYVITSDDQIYYVCYLIGLRFI